MRAVRPARAGRTKNPAMKTMNTAIQAWLDKQCGEIGGVTGGVVMLVPRGGDARLAQAAAWPAGQRGPRELEEAAAAAYEKQAAITRTGEVPAPSKPEFGAVISHPLQVKGRTVGAFAVRLSDDVTL